MRSTLRPARHLFMFAAIALAATACGATAGGGGGGGGGTPNVGGAPATACNPAVHNEGCFNTTRVKCDAAGTWVEIALCGQGQYCAELADPAAVGTGKKVSECKQLPTHAADASGDGGDAATVGDSGGSPVSDSGVTTEPSCGDGDCDDGENPTTCPADCKTSGPTCGDEKCDDGETATTCPADCKTPAPTCGNSVCENGEDPTICPTDCKAGSECGNGQCEKGETTATCPTDCKSASGCGDGKCLTPEDASSCVIDCDEIYTPYVPCLKEKCASQYNSCMSTPGCMDALNCAAKCIINGSAEGCTSACIEKAGAATSVLIPLGQCGTACNPEIKQPECSASKPCGSGKKCVEGTCVPDIPQPECSASKPCGGGKKCVEGTCVPDIPQPECSASKPCPTGKKCDNTGKCVADTEPGCGDGKCEGNEKVTCPSDCGNPTGSCKDKCGKFEQGASCQCDEQCTQYKDCCPDYVLLCKP